jgi:hypothetical protein
MWKRELPQSEHHKLSHRIAVLLTIRLEDARGLLTTRVAGTDTPPLCGRLFASAVHQAHISTPDDIQNHDDKYEQGQLSMEV